MGCFFSAAIDFIVNLKHQRAALQKGCPPKTLKIFQTTGCSLDFSINQSDGWPFLINGQVLMFSVSDPILPIVHIFQFRFFVFHFPSEDDVIRTVRANVDCFRF